GLRLNSAQTRLLVVGKGLGREKISKLKEEFSDQAVVIPDIPDPADDVDEGVRIMKEMIKKEEFDVLVAGSRGGKVVAELVNSGTWKGPTLLVSAMHTSKILSEGSAPVLIAHATGDGT